MKARHGHDSDWRQYLHALPAADPPAALRARVLARAAPGRPSRRPLWALAAAAALALVALRIGMAPEPAPRNAALLASQQLEHRVLDSEAAADPRLQAGIAEIDRALGAAYRRGAGGEELDTLWRARARALEQGLAAAPAVPARI